MRPRYALGRAAVAAADGAVAARRPGGGRVVSRAASLAIACTHVSGASRPADRDRRVVPASGGADVAHARRRADPVRGPAAAVHRGAGHAARAPSPRAALPPEALGAAGRDRPAAVDRRPQLQHRVPRAPHGAAAPGLRGAAAAAGRADLLPAARPLQAAVGGVDGRGPRGRGLRAHHQDPSRADRRHRGRRHRPGHVRPRPGPGRGPPPRRAVAARAASRPGRSCWPRARWAWCAPACARPRRPRRWPRGRPRPCARRASPSRASARSRGRA